MEYTVADFFLYKTGGFNLDIKSRHLQKSGRVLQVLPICTKKRNAMSFLKAVAKSDGLLQAAQPLFAYRTGNSFLHKMHPFFKLILLLGFSALVFLFSDNAAYLPFFSLCFILIARFIGFSFLQQLKDLKAILPYCVLLFCLHFISNFFKQENNIKDLLFIILKLSCLIQISSLFFNTTSSLQLKESLEKILPFKIAVLFSLFLFFIPLLFSIWTKLNYAWKARYGKNGFIKFFKLLPLFISEAFYKSQKLLYALQNRSG